MDNVNKYEKPNMSLLLMISIVASLGGLLFGFDIAIISGTVPFIKDYFDLNELMLGWGVSSLLIGCIFGAAFAGKLSDHMTRRPGRNKIVSISLSFSREYRQYIFACSKAKVYAEAGADVIGLGDDIGTQNTIMIDKDLWKRWLQPRLKKVIDTARSVKPDVLIFYHSCGYITPFIDDLIETGIDILNPVQPECMDFNEIHDAFSDRLSFWGTIGTQQLLPFGTPDEVYANVKDRLNKCAAKGGIVIGPTHLVEPEVSWENLLAIKEAVRDFEKKL